MTNHNLTRKYDSDFSATEVKDTLNSVAKEAGSDLKTPVMDAKPWRDGDRENYFEVETRAGVGHLDAVLGSTQGQHFTARYRVVGTQPNEDKAIVKVEKVN